MAASISAYRIFFRAFIYFVLDDIHKTILLFFEFSKSKSLPIFFKKVDLNYIFIGDYSFIFRYSIVKSMI